MNTQSKEHTQWIASVWKANDERNKLIEKAKKATVTEPKS